MTTHPMSLKARVFIWIAVVSFFCNGMAAFLSSLNGNTAGVLFGLVKVALTAAVLIYLSRRTTFFQD